MSDFPNLEPAFTFHVVIDPPVGVGSASRGTSLSVVPMTDGTIKSEPGFSPAIEAKFKGIGNDYIHSDATGKHMRLNAHAALETSDGALIYVNYTGIIESTTSLELILGGSPDAKTTPFGNVFTHLVFETGSEKYKDLEVGVFVAAGRFVVEEGKPVVVEYKVSRVKHG